MSAIKVNDLVDDLKRIGLTLKLNVAYSCDKDENNFAIALWNDLNKYNVKVSLTKNYYENVDIILTNPLNKKSVYIEFKQRNKCYENYNSYMIGYKKLLGIENKKLTPCLLVWSFGVDATYFIEYEKDFITKYKNGICNTNYNSASVVYIDKIDCISGFDKLIIKIKELLLVS
jgi:hypothetical protein